MPFSFGAGAIDLAIQVPVQRQSGNDNYPLLLRIPKRTIGQSAIRWNADVGGATVTGEVITAAATTANSYNSVVPASLPIGESRFRHTFSVLTTRLAEAQNNGEGELANLLAYAADAGMRQIMRTIASNLYSGASNAASGGMTGMAALHGAVTSALSTSTYAGIAPGDHARWTNYVNTAADPRALTDDLLFTMSEQIIGGATLGVSSNYTAIYTTPALATKYKLAFQAVSDLNALPGGRADVGYSSMSFEGRPVYADPYCPAGALYFVDENELSLYSYVEGSNAYGQEVSDGSIGFKIVELARSNPDAVDFSIVTKTQLQIARRAAVGSLLQLT